MTLEHKCAMADICSKAGNESFCNPTCYPYTRLHGENGNGGLLAVANVPSKYKSSSLRMLPFEEDNPRTYAIIQKYGSTIVDKVNQGVGLYLFGVPSQDNPKGTGTGKTTAATALIVEYLRNRVVMEVKGEQPIHKTPAYFVKMAKFQNTFNKQFRGSKDKTEAHADIYEKLKSKMIETDFLVLDDIGLRGTTESLQNEIYEIIDERETNERATIFTSNVPLDQMDDIMTPQITSRIEGMVHSIPFQGKDHRKKEL